MKCLGYAKKETPSRRVRYEELFLASTLLGRCEPLAELQLWANQSHRALRDGAFFLTHPRHFVPGYDRLVPSGQKKPLYFKGLPG